MIIDGIRIGHLSKRDFIPFNAMLIEAGLHSAVTSCDAYIIYGKAGSAHQNKIYSATLNVDWFNKQNI